MKNKFLVLAVTVLLLSGASRAFAFSVDHSTLTNPDGTSRFSDPDERSDNAAPGGQPGFLPLGNGTSLTFGATQTTNPGLRFAAPCGSPACAAGGIPGQ